MSPTADLPCVPSPAPASIRSAGRAGERVELTCSFLAHPDWSLDILWVADFSPAPHTINQAQQIQAPPTQLSGGAATTLLYDSRFDTIPPENFPSGSTKAKTTTTTTNGPSSRKARIKFESSGRRRKSSASATNERRGGRTTKSTTTTAAPDSGSASLETRLSIESVSPSDAAR